MSLHHQKNSPHFQFRQSPHRQRICVAEPPHITPGLKLVEGLAWWPGFIPFTLDGSTANTAPFQITSPGVGPYTDRKYLTYHYSSIGTVNYTIHGEDGSIWTETCEVDLVFTWDSDYGDLAAASYYSRRTASETHPGGPFENIIDESWVRADGFFIDSDVADYVTLNDPFATLWWLLSDASIRCRASEYFLSRHAFGDPDWMIITAPMTINPTSMSSSESGSWSDLSPSEGPPTSGDWVFETAIELDGEVTRTNRAEAAKALSDLASLTTSDWVANMFISGSPQITRWRDPGAYSSSATFTFTDYANTLGSPATNRVTVCNNRYAAGPIFARRPVKYPSDIIVAYGVQGATDFSVGSPADFWDEPQEEMAILSARSIYNLIDGLFCGNTVSITDPDTGFPVTLYYDYEAISPVLSDGSTGTISKGVVGVLPSNTVRPFPILELQGYLSGRGVTFGSGWLGKSPGGSRPAC